MVTLEQFNEVRKKKNLPVFLKWTGTAESMQDAYNKLTGSNGHDDEPASAPAAESTPEPEAKPAPKVKAKVKAKPVEEPEELPERKYKVSKHKPSHTSGRRVMRERDSEKRTRRVAAKAERIMANHDKIEANVKKVERKLTTVSLAEVCAKVKQTTKQARSLLRNAYAKGVKGLPRRTSGPWTFEVKDVPLIEKIIEHKPR